MIIKRPVNWIQKRATPITREQREFWKCGHAALTSMIKAVKAVAGEVAKHEGGSVDAALRTVHAGLSPIWRAVRRMQDEAIAPAQVDEDPELAKLRDQLDADENMGVEPPAPGNAAPLDEEPMDHMGNLRKPTKPFAKAFTGWPMGASRTTKRAPERRARIL